MSLLLSYFLWWASMFHSHAAAVVFDCPTSARFLYYSMATYNTPTAPIWDCPYCQGVPSFQLSASCNSGAANYTEAGYAYVGYNKEEEEVVVAFRGSSNIANWVQNIRIEQMNFPGVPGATVSTGFFSYYSNLKSCVLAALKALPAETASYPLRITGHSLGGAAATIAVLDLSANDGLKASDLYTYGSPRVGNEDWVEAVMDVVPNAQRMTNGGDCVTKVPPASGPQTYVQVNTEIWEYPQASGDYQVCDSAIGTENPSCSLSQPPNCGADHTYMGMLDASMAPLCPSSAGDSPALLKSSLGRPSSRSKTLGHPELPAQS